MNCTNNMLQKIKTDIYVRTIIQNTLWVNGQNKMQKKNAQF